jgi:hypothetical protein
VPPYTIQFTVCGSDRHVGGLQHTEDRRSLRAPQNVSLGNPRLHSRGGLHCEGDREEAVAKCEKLLALVESAIGSSQYSHL